MLVLPALSGCRVVVIRITNGCDCQWFTPVLPHLCLGSSSRGVSRDHLDGDSDLARASVVCALPGFFVTLDLAGVCGHTD